MEGLFAGNEGRVIRRFAQIRTDKKGMASTDDTDDTDDKTKTHGRRMREDVDNNDL
jgi:hypothetical protein